MTNFTRGNNQALDRALDLVGPHDSHYPDEGVIEVGELPKIFELFKKTRHGALKMLHFHGSDALIEAFLESGIYTGGHRLKITTRVDIALERMNSEGRQLKQRR